MNSIKYAILMMMMMMIITMLQLNEVPTRTTILTSCIEMERKNALLTRWPVH